MGIIYYFLSIERQRVYRETFHVPTYALSCHLQPLPFLDAIKSFPYRCRGLQGSWTGRWKETMHREATHALRFIAWTKNPGKRRRVHLEELFL